MFISGSKVTLKEMIDNIKHKVNYEVSRSQCHMAKKIGRKTIKGKLSHHHAKVWNYAHEMLRSNHGSTCKVQVFFFEKNVRFKLLSIMMEKLENATNWLKENLCERRWEI